MSNPITIDHDAQAQSRLATQYKKSANLSAYNKALISESNDLETVFQEMLSKFDLDTAVGDQLDILGIIVGQSRYVPINPNQSAFGYIGAPNAGNYGDGSGTVGEPWFNFAAGYGGGILGDADYKTFIRARISRNHSNGTINDMIIAVRQITGVADVVVTDGVMAFDLEIKGTIDPLIQNILTLLPEILPIPAGVSLGTLTFTP